MPTTVQVWVSFPDGADVLGGTAYSHRARGRGCGGAIVFGVLISNTDDHLRNHGFLHDRTGGWRLSPVFDINPNPQPGIKHLATAIDGDTVAHLDTAMHVAATFRVTDPLVVLGEVARAVSQWRSAAAADGRNRRDLEQMEPAFHQLDRADALLTA